METFYPTYIGNSRGLVLSREFPSLRHNNYYSQVLGKNEPIWIDTNNLWSLYSQIPHLNIAINKFSEIFSLGKVALYKGTQRIESHPFIDLLNNPNPLQSRDEFLRQYCVFKLIYGNAFIYKLSGFKSQEIPSVLWNLPPQFMKVVPTGKIFRQSKIEQIIKHYEFCYRNYDGEQKEIFTTDEIIFKNENLSENFLASDSKILSLIKPLSNIVGALQTANILINQRGAYGILSNDSKDAFGNVDLDPKERKKINKQFRRDYGNLPDQTHLIITNASMKYQPISYPMKDMMLIEEVEQDWGIVLDAYGLSRYLFSGKVGGLTSQGDANEVALRNTIQHPIQPFANDFVQCLAYNFGLHTQGIVAEMCYDYLPIMQENVRQRYTALKAKAEALTILLVNQGISLEEYKKQFEINERY